MKCAKSYDVPWLVNACETARIRLVRRKSLTVLYRLFICNEYDFTMLLSLPLSDRLQTEGERRRVVRLLLVEVLIEGTSTSR